MLALMHIPRNFSYASMEKLPAGELTWIKFVVPKAE